MKARRAQGVTMIELVISITIIAVAFSAIMGILNMLASRGSDTMMRSQAAFIADSYLQRVLKQPFANIVALNDAGARTQFGAAVANMDQYQISVTVTAVAFGAPAIPQAAVRRVDVAVTDPSGNVTRVTGFRTNHPSS